MWLVIFGVSIVLAVAAALYMSHKIGRTGVFANMQNRIISGIVCILIVVAAAVILCLVFDVTNFIVIFVHLAGFLLIGDLVCHVVNTSFGKDIKGQYFDVVAVTACLIYLCVGWYLMHGLWETDYTVTSSKGVAPLKIAQIADSHVGTGFSGKGFGERLDRIQESAPDILVITGDFVDDSTGKEDMLDACEALGKFETPYGKYFCFGNHDRGYYDNSRRGYTGDDLVAELEKNGVKVLEDESVLVDDRFYVIGRADAGYGGSARMPIADLIADLDASRYMIVLDHQPTDYEAEEAANVDLVLSGHTHGGQIWPLEYVQPVVSENDNVRGYERRGNTDFIVTDGISDWAVKFKTGCRSEYNIITVSE